jgi:hypothetical protein
MVESLIAASDLAPPPADELTFEQRIGLWLDLMQTCEAFLLAGLSREVGPRGDVNAAHRQWYAERMKEHDQTMERMVEELDRRLKPRG